MPFQLHIRQNLDAARDHFGPGEVRRFEVLPVRVGAAADCECPLPAPEFAPCHFLLRADPSSGSRVWACPQEGATLYLGGAVLTEPAVVRSGDELRVGHWTLRFQSIHAAAARKRSFNLVSSLAKAALGLILCAEVVLVVWLPRRLHQTAVWQGQIVRHRVADLLDRLRWESLAQRAVGDFERALQTALDAELRLRAEYVAAHGDQLSAAQNRLLFEELTAFERTLKALTSGKLPPPLPSLDLDAGVRAVLNAPSGR